MLTYWYRKRYLSIRWPEGCMIIDFGDSLVGKSIIGDFVALGTAILLLAFTET